MRRLRDYKLRDSIAEEREFYERDWAAATIRSWQLQRFNEQWQTVRTTVPYFARLNREMELPPQFSSWKEFKEALPVMDRKVVQDQRGALHDNRRGPDYWKSTGGSTAEPLQMGAWNSERTFAEKDLWYARSWFALKPSSRLFLIWGHSHLLGNGFRGRINGFKRRLSDRALGYYRFSAYDLSDEQLKLAAARLLEFRPAYVLGYAGALDLFARVNQRLEEAFRQLNLKIAIATGESFPKDDSAQLISDVLGCPVVMEYGSVETGLVAHQTLKGNFKVFWRHYFLEGQESEHLPGTYELLVTSLYPRCCPLVRYRLGDLVSSDPAAEEFKQEFGRVIGRCNDLLVLPNGQAIHSEAFSHAVKESPAIANYQVVQSSAGQITLNYVATAPLQQPELLRIRERLVRINPELMSISIKRVDLLEQTVAGKTRHILRES